MTHYLERQSLIIDILHRQNERTNTSTMPYSDVRVESKSDTNTSKENLNGPDIITTIQHFIHTLPTLPSNKVEYAIQTLPAPLPLLDAD